jgi:hypothetical protein
MKSFPQLTRAEVVYDLPMIQGWPMLTAGKLADPMCERELDGGYVWQERRRLKGVY